MGTTAVVAPLVASPLRALNLDQVDEPLKVHLFSKHLQFLGIKEAAQISAELGFDGLDLTVRPKGHVWPENAKSDLPVAIREIRRAGVACDMITTAITDTHNVHDLEIIKVAAKEDIQFYRSNWFKYHKGKPMPESISIYQQRIKELGEANQKYGIIGCYQNHAGRSIGSSFWEIKFLLETVDANYFGTQYDIRHAMVEGGLSWQNGLELLKNHIKTIVLKDFKWERVDGQWKAVNVPIGEGMVDFVSYFKLLKKYGLNPPASLHLEYPMGGAEKGRYEIEVDQKVVFDAMQRDLAAVKRLWKEA
ncbi:Sugar phosphate isomerase/epimerase [Reichenbachiella faecimaris]|uniref:Sugar phosphate isomerase/epimerase n=1 Tax=Reichenbachiella faecimaris TaxID=692418 RepID=A0A1W2GNB9_REIFA|nr:Sugar phosphate isomerase/epimerase [Reichenbachiella faecimaris]